MAVVGIDSSITAKTTECTDTTISMAIEHVALETRVPDQNPRKLDYDFSLRPVEQETWRRVDVRLRRADGAVVEMQLLRPVEWIANLALTIGCEFKLLLSEFEVDGNATVTAIDSCCEIEEGAGSVVTGRFVTRQVSNLIEVTLENGTTLTGTTTHAISVPLNEDWVKLGDLKEGDQVATLSGLVTVAKVNQPTLVSDVFNIEVHGHHVYRITDDGILVHNNSSLGLIKEFGNIGSHAAMSADDALKHGINWLGAGYKEIAPGVFRSADGLRQFRRTTADLLGSHGNVGSHVHIEALDIFGRVIENLHLPIF